MSFDLSQLIEGNHCSHISKSFMVYQWNKYRTKSLNKQVKRLRISHKKLIKSIILCNLLILSVFL